MEVNQNIQIDMYMQVCLLGVADGFDTIKMGKAFLVGKLSRRLNRHYEKSAAVKAGVLSTIYAAFSIAMVFTNKVIVREVNQTTDVSSEIVLVIQCLVAVLLGLIMSFTTDSYSLRIELSDFKILILSNLAFIGTIIANSETLRYLSVQMVTLLKNTALVFTAFGDCIFMKTHFTFAHFCAIILMLIGSYCGIVTDVSGSIIGYLWMAASWIFSSWYVLATKSGLKHMHHMTVAFYNNLASVIIFTVYLWFTDSTFFTPWLRGTAMPPHLSCKFILFSGVLGFALNISSYKLLGYTTATSYVVVGAAKKIAQAILAFIFFKNASGLGNKLSILIGISGAILYSAVKYNEQKEKEAAQENDPLTVL